MRKIREARAALQAEALAEVEQSESEGRKHPGVPADQAQRNFTDPDSRIMPGPGGRDFQQSYNCQAVVDSGHQVIVAARATNATSDKQQAAVMVEEAIGNVGTAPREVSAGAGYYSAKAVAGLYDLEVDPFIAPEKTRHGRVLEPAPRSCIPQGLSARDRMRRKLRTKAAGSATPSGWRRLNRCSGISSRAESSSSSRSGVWRRSTGSGCSSAPATTC